MTPDRLSNTSRQFRDRVKHLEDARWQGLAEHALTPLRFEEIWDAVNDRLCRDGYVDQETRRTVYFGSARPRSYYGTGLEPNGLGEKLEAKQPEFLVLASRALPSTLLEVVGERLAGPGPIELVIIAKESGELRRLKVPRDGWVGRPAPAYLTEKLPFIEVVEHVVKSMSPVRDERELEGIDFTRDDTPTFLLPELA